ncbi:urease accessory protein [Flammeovirgaceae bacterium 311]|nr:urease accessory protein [Flammeovirgaceae bacterium 311]
MGKVADWSEIEVARVQGKSVLTSCKSLQPLKILNPRTHSSCCHVVLSNYGGGMVAGDTIQLRIKGAADTRLAITTQANSRIFKTLNGSGATQTLEGELEKGGVAVVFSDPVVMQEESQYRQYQRWQIAPEALLFVADWLSSGRADLGEQFKFRSYSSELQVKQGEKMVLLDRFQFSPGDHIAGSPANFSHYQTVLSAYMVGDPADQRFQLLAEALNKLKEQEQPELGSDLSANECVVAITKAREGVYVLRAGAKSRSAMQPVVDAMMNALSTADILDFNPFKRKF